LRKKMKLVFRAISSQTRTRKANDDLF